MAQIIGELLIKYFPNQFKIEDKRTKKMEKKKKNLLIVLII